MIIMISCTTHHNTGIDETDDVEGKGDDEGEVDSEVVGKTSVGEHVREVDGVGHDEEARAKGREVVTRTDCHCRVGAYHLSDTSWVYF